MKKLLLILLIFTAFSTYAQKKSNSTYEPLLNKKGNSILPEERDWSIGFDANFIIGYVGNLFNNSTSNPGGRPNYLTPNTIIGKYMKTRSLAYIGMLRIGNTATKVESPIYDQSSTVYPKFLTTDTWKNDSMSITLGAGFQKFRGKGRLQGVYGATLSFSYGRKKDTYTYGNPIDANHAVNGDPTSVDYNSTNFGTGIVGMRNIDSVTVAPNYARVTEAKSGTIFGVGVRGFVGIEYFFATKMSLGAQYGWGINFISMGQGEASEEFLDNTNSQKATASIKTSDLSSFNIDTDNASGQISLNFYF
jgi:hypothetical protein